jgi:hypothetical protein
MHYAGEVYLLPPDAREEGDPKPRRHLLLSTQKAPGDILVFAFASTEATEASFGAAYFLLDPSRPRTARRASTRRPTSIPHAW